MLFFTNHTKGDSAGDKAMRAKVLKILSFMYNPYVKVYLHFLVFTLRKVNVPNKEFQTVSIQINKPIENYRHTLFSLLKYLIRPDTIKNTGILLESKNYPVNF